MKLKNNFGPALKWLRIRHGLSQEAIAKELNIERQMISHYEKGHSKPSFDKVLQVANFFDVDLSEFVEKVEKIQK